jgi:DNA polymerase II large subunit
MEEYFQELEKNVLQCYAIADLARKQGYDPEDRVDIPLAKNMAERVEGLISAVAPQIKGTNMVKRIEELEEKYGKLDWRVALTIALEIAQEKFCSFEDERKAMETGIRAGLAYMTIGVVASPLEGFVELKIKNRKDGKKYFCLMFSGPIRSAGGTAASSTLVIADYVRKNMGYSEYDPTDIEIKRGVTELYDYHEKVTNLQYLPSEEEIAFMVKNLPVQVDGDPSEKYEVSNYKDLERIETNRLRNGFCLVIGEGITQKAPKVWMQISNWGKEMGMEHWDFLEKFLKIQKKIKAKDKDLVEEETKLNPDYTYIKDLVAGRPILTHPLRIGGFRLRYGRSRTSGLSSTSIHPATMHILNNYIATGTQLKCERPGKSSAIAPCDSIEGPIVKLKNGDVLFLDNEKDAKKCAKEVEEILFLGDYLVNYGDFFNRAHKLIPCGYNEEWYSVELEKAAKDKDLKELGLNDKLINKIIENPRQEINCEQAIEISKKLKIPLHPRYTYHWNDISKKQILILVDWLSKAEYKDKNLKLPVVYDVKKDVEGEDPKRILELLGVPHKFKKGEYVIIEDDWALAFKISLENIDENKEKPLEILNKDLIFRDKSGTFIGARMGRPEKAKIRRLTGSPQVLFPVGKEGGRLRCFQAALEQGKVTGEFPLYSCEWCNKNTIYSVCETCGNKTKKRYYCDKCDKEYKEDNCAEHGKLKGYKLQELDIKYYFKNALDKLKLEKVPELIKGVRGTSNKNHVPENLVKGILRASHNLYVNKDGTIRFDITEMPITHFKAKEIGTSVDKLRELGYEKDIYGKKIIEDDQLIEIKPQDVILPKCTDAIEEGADEILFRTGKFIDDLLVQLYGLKKFYNFKSKKDLVGHLVIVIAPHISAGMIGRIIGFSDTQAFYAHPMMHCAIRRDADGDETAVILLMDTLLNFSRQYLPAHRGATQDAPLVLTSKLIPSEVDDMVFHIDVVWRYPLEFYEAAMNYKKPWDIKIEQLKHRLGTEKQFYDFGFTHDVSDINIGVRCSAYKQLPTMAEKVMGQMDLAEKIRAVDETDVARLIIERHFLRDIKGNLRKFSMQQFRCSKCNEKYRRPPIKGSCLKCGGNIIFTIAEGSIVKYLEPSIQLAEKYALPAYLKQSIDLTKRRIESIFGKDLEKQESMIKWFG